MSKAILLMAYGGPENIAEIEPFMQRLLRRKQLPPGLLQRVEKKYQAIGGGSPLPSICRQIRAKLADTIDDMPVFLGFRYAEPSIETAVAKMIAKGVTEVLAISLSPHSSTISSAAYYQTIEQVTTNRKLKLKRLEGWYQESAYNNLIANRILSTAQAQGLQLNAPDTQLIFSAHNIPQSYVDKGDTYVDEITANIKAVTGLLPDCLSSMAYQSKGNIPGAWLKPEIEEHLLDLKEKGIRNIMVVPVSFSMDHLETLYDLDLELKDFCDRNNINLCRSKPANADDDFISMLANFIKKS